MGCEFKEDWVDSERPRLKAEATMWALEIDGESALGDLQKARKGASPHSVGSESRLANDSGPTYYASEIGLGSDSGKSQSAIKLGASSREDPEIQDT